jgi:beta-glucanase (GH16 family)
MTVRLKLLSSFLLILFALNGKSQWNLVWADEFDGPTLNSSNWVSDVGGWGWGNNESQYYTDGDNLSFANGELSIEAKQESFGANDYTSGKIISKDKFEFQYGRVESRIKVPSGQGLWPAFWMLGANIDEVSWPYCGEIDIMEHINSENLVHGTIHWENNGHVYFGGNTSFDPNAYHVYALEWDPSEIRWYLDGDIFHTADIANGINGTSEFHEDFYLILNLAVGGDWPGYPDGSTVFPAQMLIDYVRVYKNQLDIIAEVCTPASEVRMTGPWWGWDPAGGPIATDNGDGTWTFNFDPAPSENMEYLLVVDGVQENLVTEMQNGADCAPVTDYFSYANRLWLSTDPQIVTATYGQCTECTPPPDLLIITEVCTPASEVRLTGPWWGWDPSSGPFATDNGDGTWTFTFSPGPTEDMEYLLVVDGVQENLIAAMQNGGSCAPVTDYANYANRLWQAADTPLVYTTYGQCDECLEVPVDCPPDLDGNGTVNTADLLILLSAFGSNCLE